MRAMTKVRVACAAVGAIAWWATGTLAAQKSAPLPSTVPPVLWHSSGEGRGRPAADDQTAYFLSKNHEVRAFDAASGAQRWSQVTGEPGEATSGSTLVLAGPVVVAGDYNLAAFAPDTGNLRWRFLPAVGYAPGIYLGEASNALVFAGSATGRVYAVGAASGELVWSAQVAPSTEATAFPPATDGHVVVVAFTVFGRPASGGVVCLDAATGHELWRFTFPKAVDPLLGVGSAGGPIVADDVVVASSGDGRVFGLDRTTGRLRWSLPPVDTIPPILRGPTPLPPGAPGPDFRPLARSGPLLFVGSLKGDVVAYELSTQRERWRFLDASQGSVSFALSSDDRSVYVPFASGRHVALAASNGAERWRTPSADDGFHWPSVSSRRRVFLAGTKGGFVALGR